jgi:GT2 family glycosyltransferase
MSNHEIKISVIVPTYERPLHLHKLLRRLSKSSFRYFEVIVIDQSAVAANIEDFKKTLVIQYHHVSFRGAALARNFGAKFAKGAIIAFIDDDCIPAKTWLENAYICFSHNEIVGLEGRIYPERNKTNPLKYRIVSNVGRENYAFMTANLFVLRELFVKLEGFDERFNDPHFREDTDFGWRLQNVGEVMFSNDVKVLHPSELQKAGENRNNFFVHDVLLFMKHPEKYLKLFVLEQHYIYTEGFWDYFLQGFVRHNADYSLLHKLLAYKSVNLGYIPMQKLLPFLR